MPDGIKYHFGRKPSATGYASRLADLGQQKHLYRLTRLFPERLPAMNEVDCSAANLETVLRRQLQSVRHDYGGIQLDGAETAARCIHRAIDDQGNLFYNLMQEDADARAIQNV